jgi:hypothetical protein
LTDPRPTLPTGPLVPDAGSVSRRPESWNGGSPTSRAFFNMRAGEPLGSSTVILKKPCHWTPCSMLRTRWNHPLCPAPTTLRILVILLSTNPTFLPLTSRRRFTRSFGLLTFHFCWPPERCEKHNCSPPPNPSSSTKKKKKNQSVVSSIPRLLFVLSMACILERACCYAGCIGIWLARSFLVVLFLFLFTLLVFLP